jgi:GNAT superfamily N-acetyltransferase
MAIVENIDGGAEVSIAPANEASWQDLQLVFGKRGDPATCQCQWFKVPSSEWRSLPLEQLQERLREQTGCGHPDARSTSGLAAYLEGEPVGWVAVEPRIEYLARLARSRIAWAGRDENKDDPEAWAVTCFVTRAGFRHRGISRALAMATVDHARHHGARSLEAYPVATEPGENVIWGQLYIGSVSIFERAGFEIVAAPTPRRRVMRINF